MNSREDEPRCCRCGRRVRPKWEYCDGRFLIDRNFSGGVSSALIGPTCRKKLIADGVGEDDFRLVEKKA